MHGEVCFIVKFMWKRAIEKLTKEIIELLWSEMAFLYDLLRDSISFRKMTTLFIGIVFNLKSMRMLID